MRHYLATLHTKPEHHKKRFAFAVSGGFTLIIFTFWALATFGTGGTLAQDPSTSSGQATNNRQQEISPFQSLRTGVASGLEGLSEAIGGLKSGVQGAFDFETDYTEMRDGVLNTYGQ